MRVFGFILLSYISVTSFAQKHGEKTIYTGYESIYAQGEAKRFWQTDVAGRMLVDSLESEDKMVHWTHPTEHYRYAQDSIIGINSIIIVNAKGLPIKYISLRNQYYRIASYNADGTLKEILDDTGWRKELITDIRYEHGDIMSYYLIDSTTGKSILNKFWYDTTKIFTPYYANEKQIEGLSGAALGTNYLNVPDFSKHLLIAKETFTDKDSLSSQTNFSYTRAENGTVSVIGKTYWDIWIGEQIVNHNLRLKKE